MVFSFGCADLMARRRGTSEDDINQLLNKGAIGEAFGHYFDKDGNIVMKLNTVGIDMNMYKNSKYPIAVFSGVEKVDAFMALYKLNKNLTLITDEDTAIGYFELNKQLTILIKKILEVMKWLKLRLMDLVE